MILRTALGLEVLDHPVHLAIGHERSVDALRMPSTGRQIKHVALPEQSFGAHLVEDGARIDLARDLERDARRNVGLDETGDDVDRGPLRREDQVDARSARFLRDPRDQLFDLLAGYHHQIGKLVDDYDDQRHFVDRLGIVGRQRKRVGQRLLRLARFDDAHVVAGKVPHAQRRHQPVAPLHFPDAPAERVGGELDVGDNRRQKMRNALVDRQLEHLRIDQDQPYLPRLGLVQQRQNHRVQRDRLARACGSGDEQVGHACQIDDHRLARDVLSQRERQRARQIVVRRGREQLDQSNELISRPMHDLPGMVSTTRIDTTDSARARSFTRFTIWLPLTPIAGSISKRVITGPG